MSQTAVIARSELPAPAPETAVSHLESLRAVLPRLALAPPHPRALWALAPELVCELGFDRALIGRVADQRWHPERMHIVGDPAWADQIAAAGRAAPLKLLPGLHETELVRTRKPILVLQAQRQSPGRWGHPALVKASRTRSYVAAPLVSGGEVVGILTADRYGSGRDVDAGDRELLAAFADVLQLALGRAVLAEKLRSVAGSLRGMCRTIESPAQSGPDGAVPLPETLTARELQVLELLAAGSTNAAIARRLHISEGTAKQHVKNIFKKLRVTSRSEAIVRWFHAGADQSVN